MKSVKLVNKPNPNNSNLKTNDYFLVATLDKKDREVPAIFNEATKIGPNYIVPMKKDVKGKTISHVWDLSGIYSLKLRLEKATCSDAEMIVILKELIDALHKIENIPVQYVDFDADRIFITETGTISFMIWAVEGRKISGNIITLLETILNSAEPTCLADQTLFEELKKRIPTNKEQYKEFVNTVYASYTKLVESTKSKDKKSDAKETKKETTKPSKKGVISKKKQEVKKEIKEESTENANPLFSKMLSQIQVDNNEDKTTINTTLEDMDVDMESDKTAILDNDTSLEEEFYQLFRDSTGEVYELVEGENIIGRSDNADITIHNNRTISGKHLSVILENDKLFLKDLNSSNGTFVNDKKLNANTRVSIEQDTEFRVSDENFIVGKGVS